MSDDPLDDIGRAMVRIRRSQTRRTLGRAAERELGRSIDLTAAAVVDAVAEGEATVGVVGERLGVGPSRASRAVARAVDRGLVVRAAAQQDGRRIELHLTDDGRRYAAAMDELRRRRFAAATADWTARERALFADLLGRFVDALDA